MVRNRRSERRVGTRAEILSVAWGFVRSEGLAALSLRDLSRGSGCRHPPCTRASAPSTPSPKPCSPRAPRADLEAGATVPTSGDPLTDLRAAGPLLHGVLYGGPGPLPLMFQRTIPGFEPPPEAFAIAVRGLDRLRARLWAARIVDERALCRILSGRGAGRGCCAGGAVLSETRVTEVAEGIHQLTTHSAEIDFGSDQYPIAPDEPLLSTPACGASSHSCRRRSGGCSRPTSSAGSRSATSRRTSAGSMNDSWPWPRRPPWPSGRSGAWFRSATSPTGIPALVPMRRSALTGDCAGALGDLVSAVDARIGRPGPTERAPVLTPAVSSGKDAHRGAGCPSTPGRGGTCERTDHSSPSSS